MTTYHCDLEFFMSHFGHLEREFSHFGLGALSWHVEHLEENVLSAVFPFEA